MRFKFSLLIALTIVGLGTAIGAHRIAPATAKSTAAIVRSNENAKLLRQSQANTRCLERVTTNDLRLSVELLHFNPDFMRCRQQQLAQTLTTLQTKRQREADPSTRLDLDILIQAAQNDLEADRLADKYELPYLDLAQEIATTLTQQVRGVKTQPRQQMLVRHWQRYAGLEPGSTALVTIAEQRLRQKLQTASSNPAESPTLHYPNPDQLEKDLQKLDQHLRTIEKTLREFPAADSGEIPSPQNDASAITTALKSQLQTYATLVKQEVLPLAQANFRLPAELYAFRLKIRGIEVPIEEVVQQAHLAFNQVQQRMDALAAKIAPQKGLPPTAGYRQVIRALKKAQLPRDRVAPLYQSRQQALETIIRTQRLVTLPKQSVQVRLSTPAENQTLPVPQYLRKNNDQAGVFIIPVPEEVDAAGQRAYDDFTYDAVTWTLTAHEGRPGHDLQFATIHDRELSTARSQIGYNPANHEGWALYAESMVFPWMPIDGQLISLQFQLLRSARAFLEPELQMGKITKEVALQVLMADAGYSKFFAELELKRYTRTMVGQAPAYFYGFQQLVQLRSQAEQILGNRFNPQRFHDLILSQGFLPQRLLRQAVLEQFGRS